MKVLVNGGLNFSELDGWWAEAYAPSVGWALGDGREHGEDPAWDAVEAAQLYELLERVIPEFYARDEQGIPRAWVARVRESMARLTPIYSANRSVREYVEGCYLPAAAAYRQRSQNNGALAIQMSAWRHAIDRGWPTLRFGRFAVDTRGDRHHIAVEVELGALDPQSVRVELYADSLGASPIFQQEMTHLGRPDGNLIDHYVANVPATRAAGDYTARILPTYPGVNVPLEAPRIFWQR